MSFLHYKNFQAPKVFIIHFRLILLLFFRYKDFFPKTVFIPRNWQSNIGNYIPSSLKPRLIIPLIPLIFNLIFILPIPSPTGFCFLSLIYPLFIYYSF